DQCAPGAAVAAAWGPGQPADYPRVVEAGSGRLHVGGTRARPPGGTAARLRRADPSPAPPCRERPLVGADPGPAAWAVALPRGARRRRTSAWAATTRLGYASRRRR